MIELGTWLAVAILGPGSAVVFVWFLVDLRKMLTNNKPRAKSDEPRA